MSWQAYPEDKPYPEPPEELVRELADSFLRQAEPEEKRDLEAVARWCERHMDQWTGIIYDAIYERVLGATDDQPHE